VNKNKVIPNLKEEKVRSSYLTNAISIALFVLTVIVGFVYFFFESSQSLKLTVWLVSPLFIVPYFLNRLKRTNISRLWLATIFPIAIMFISVHSKSAVMGAGLINPVNYFDIRIILLNAAIIPFVLYSIGEWKQLLAALAPAAICLLLFDPIHDFFNVGYYQSGLTSHDYYFSANLFTVITFVFLTIIMLFLKIQVLKSDIRYSTENDKITTYLHELVKLSNSHSINNGKVEDAKQEIIRSAEVCLGVSRVSIWKFNNDRESIICEYLLENNEISTPRTELFATDYPSYFVELKHQQLIIATDATTHAATYEFADSYLKPLSIFSMMDAPFLSKGKLGGVICCEHKNEFKQWGAAESLLLKALGDFLSYTIIVDDRLRQNQLLTEKNQEVSRVNENLEAIVNKRTEELEEKNRQLTEYAYINSHVLRAPVARISGLYNLFKIETGDMMNGSAIFGYMENSISELETITVEINRAIEENSTLDRNKFMN
jgi:hypothetical protein